MSQDPTLPPTADPTSDRYLCQRCGLEKDAHSMGVDPTGAVVAGSWRTPTDWQPCGLAEQVWVVVFCFHDPIKKSEGGDLYAFGESVACARGSLEDALGWCGVNSSYRPHRDELWWWFEVHQHHLTDRSAPPIRCAVVSWDGISLLRPPYEGYPRKGTPAKVIPFRGVPPPSRPPRDDT